MSDTYIALLEAAITEMSGLSRIHSYIAANTCGILTAFRGDIPNAENLARNRELRTQLRNLNYSVTPVKGAYIEDFAGIDPKEVSENSLFVANHTVDGDDHGQLRDDLIRLGARYDQDSILYIPHGGKGTLIGTSGRDSAYPPLGDEAPQGKFLALGDEALKQHEFLSRVKRRPFVFTDQR